MAIQKINLGTEPLGEGGDTYRSANAKINENFGNTEHAASRLVGTTTGRVPLSEDVGKLARSDVTYTVLAVDVPNYNVNEFVAGESAFVRFNTPGSPGSFMGTYSYVETIGLRKGQPTNVMQWAISTDGTLELVVRNTRTSPWHRIYGSYNTTKDSNGMLKASSPVLRVFSDHIEGNEDGENMGAVFVKKGVGDYLIKGTTGLADEGWYVTVPQDANGNNLVAVEYESLDNGDIVLRTYKRRFDFETVRIVADHDNPLDIPDTRWIDLRFNELDQEQLEEPKPVEESE